MKYWLRRHPRFWMWLALAMAIDGALLLGAILAGAQMPKWLQLILALLPIADFYVILHLVRVDQSHRALLAHVLREDVPASQ